MSTDHNIIPFEQRHFETANQALELAFMDDPIMAYFAPDRRKREKVARWFWKSCLIMGMRWGVVDTDETGRSAAVWMPPRGTNIPIHRMMRTPFVQLPFRLGIGGLWRFLQMMGPMEKAHKRQAPDPHWYLMALGVHPDLQGKGIGSGLMAAGHTRADESGHSCYLETATEADVRFYSKRGYRSGEVLQLGTLKGTTMIRDGNRKA